MTLADLNNSDPEPYFWILFPFLFVGFWCFVCFILSHLGGWAALGKRFGADRAPIGRVFSGQSAQLRRFCNYNNCLTVIVSEEGFYVRVWPMFRLGHPPLLIPWKELHDPKERRILWYRSVTFGIGSPEIGRITISKKVSDTFPARVTEV